VYFGIRLRYGGFQLRHKVPHVKLVAQGPRLKRTSCLLIGWNGRLKPQATFLKIRESFDGSVSIISVPRADQHLR
jgi:hypothetical protein